MLNPRSKIKAFSVRKKTVSILLLSIREKAFAPVGKY